MKIIKHGKKEQFKPVEHIITCEGCGCVFSIISEDIVWTEKKMNGDSAVICPECNIEVIIKKYITYR